MLSPSQLQSPSFAITSRPADHPSKTDLTVSKHVLFPFSSFPARPEKHPARERGVGSIFLESFGHRVRVSRLGTCLLFGTVAEREARSKPGPQVPLDARTLGSHSQAK